MDWIRIYGSEEKFLAFSHTHLDRSKFQSSESIAQQKKISIVKFDPFDKTQNLTLNSRFLRDFFVLIFQMIFQSLIIDRPGVILWYLKFWLLELKFPRVWRKTGLEMSLRRLRTYVDRMALAGDLVSRRDNHFSFHMSTITTVSPRVR